MTSEGRRKHKMTKKPEYGLLIDYEYCTGCYACQVACAQEHHWPAGMGGVRVQEIVQNLPNDKHYLMYLPVFTELCVLCAARTKQGQQPSCVQTCMASCLKYGKIDDLAKDLVKPRMILWAPK